MKSTLISLAAMAFLASPALADGFSTTISAGTSPIGQAFSVRGVLAYSTTITDGLTLTAQMRLNYNTAGGTFGLSFRTTPKYTRPLFEGDGLYLSGFAGLDFLIVVLPTPVSLYVTPLVGVDLFYAVSDQFAVFAGTEFDLSLNFDGRPIELSPFVSFYVEGGYSVIDPLTVAIGVNLGTGFKSVSYNPYLNVSYDLTNEIRLILEGGYDSLSPDNFLANTYGFYIFLRGRFRF